MDKRKIRDIIRLSGTRVYVVQHRDDANMEVIKYVYVTILLLVLCSCRGKANDKLDGLPVAVDTVSSEILGMEQNGNIVIKDTVNLENRVCIVPQGITLVFKGGCIKNGALVGDNTKLKSEEACFNRVRMLGTWNVPIIKSSLFVDLNYDNSLKDVVALSNPNIRNKIIVDSGDYQVSAYKAGDICVLLNSQTDFILNGTIRQSPNDFTKYQIIQAEGENIKIRGKGTIIGDKHTHTGKNGEWGMGIKINHAHHVLIKDLTIKDCWGDCIYVGGESTDVKIERCILDHGRRQGVSITSANNVTIRNCDITNVSGTNPEYAIDIEPNKGGFVDNVVIDKVKVDNCKGGFKVDGQAPNAYIGNVVIKRSVVTNTKKIPIKVQKCNSIGVYNCIVKRTKAKKPILFEKATLVDEKNNNFE